MDDFVFLLGCVLVITFIGASTFYLNESNVPKAELDSFCETNGFDFAFGNYCITRLSDGSVEKKEFFCDFEYYSVVFGSVRINEHIIKNVKWCGFVA